MTTPIPALCSLGYRVELQDGQIRLTFVGEGAPPADRALPLVEALRADRAAAIAFLTGEKGNFSVGTATVQHCNTPIDEAARPGGGAAQATVAVGVAGGPTVAVGPDGHAAADDGATATLPPSATVAATVDFGASPPGGDLFGGQPLQRCSVAAVTGEMGNPPAVDQCEVHHRYLTYAEGLAQCCSWCEPGRFRAIATARGAPDAP
jgi:hypothetical protein